MWYTVRDYQVGRSRLDGPPHFVIIIH
jgi:hypothetical protein